MENVGRSITKYYKTFKSCSAKLIQWHSSQFCGYLWSRMRSAEHEWCYLNGDRHEHFQVIVPPLCGKTNKTSRYHDIWRNLYIDSPTYRLTCLCIFLPCGLQDHVTVQARMQGWELSGNSRTEKNGSRYKRELTSFTSRRHFLSKQWQKRHGIALFFSLRIPAEGLVLVSVSNS